MKISSITFYDYAAFYNGQDNQYCITTGNKNLLIYGENGSGKSSVFKGLRDFFRASESEEQEDFLKHNRSSDSKAGYVRVTFDDGTVEEFREDGTVPSQSFIADTNKIKGFLTYRELLKTYLKDDDSVKEPLNFFPLLVTNILKDHTFEKGGETLSERWTGILEQFETVKPFYAQVNAEEPDIEEEERDAQISQVSNFDALLKDFNEDLNALLKLLSRNVKEFLAYFQQHLEVEIIPETVSVRQDRLENQVISLKVELFGQEITNHHTFLNEARLSALALSIYLAAISTNPSESQYKILFLDDIFIGLDMSNRIPLLQILQDKFADYQIFLTTYDRYWFEVAKDWFERKTADRWTFLEMYVDDSPGFEVPCLIPTKGYRKKAKDYLASHDYPACGMYLRKESERILSNLLKPAVRLKDVKKKDEKTENYHTVPKNLNDMILGLKEFCQKEDLPYSDFEDLAIYKDALLNPLAHHDVASPIYKTELQAIMAVLKRLESVRIKELTYHQNKAFILELHNTRGERFSVEFITRDRITLIQEQSRDIRLLHCCRCEQRSIDDNGTRYDERKMISSLQELYSAVCQTFGVPMQDDLLRIVSLKGKSLHDMILEQQLF